MKAYRAHIVLLIQAKDISEACDAVHDDLEFCCVDPLSEAGIVGWQYTRQGREFTQPVEAPDIDLSAWEEHDLLS